MADSQLEVAKTESKDPQLEIAKTESKDPKISAENSTNVPKIQINDANITEKNATKKETVESSNNNACKFAIFGCDIENSEHESKKPVKHLTLFNDALLDAYRKMNKLIDDEETLLNQLNRHKLVINSIVSRNSCQLVWTIKGLNEEMRKARMRLIEVIYSEPFYSEPFGYKFRAALAPYGTNSAYGISLGLYVQLMPGEYDPILRWPFDLTVVLALFDRNPNVVRRVDFRYTLVPNLMMTNKHYLDRPRIEKENGFLGSENFVSLEELKDENYVQDDTIIVGVTINP